MPFAEFSLGLIAGGGQEGSAGGRGIGDVQIPDVLVVLEVGALDGGGLLRHAVIAELVVQRHVGQVAGETPGGGTVETGGRESVEAELVSAGVDVVRNSLQGLEVGDLINGVAGLLEQGLVHDDAEGFVAVADGNGLAGFVLQVEVGGGHLVVHVGAFEIVAELAVAVDSAEVADLEHGGGGVLVEFGGQGSVVLAGSGGDDLHGNAGLLGVGLGISCQAASDSGLKLR